VDLSPTIDSNMPKWPTHPDVGILRDARTVAVHGYFAQTLVLPEHAGCHVDAPAHLRGPDSGGTVDTLPLDTLIGPAKKFDLTAEGLEPGQTLSFARFERLAEAQALPIERGDIVLFEFGWDEHFRDELARPSERRSWWGSNMPGLDEDTCRYLSEAGVRAVGADTAGVDIAVVDGRIVSAPGHERWFLPRGILSIEGLYGLTKVPAKFIFVALPLKIAGGSGSPLRAIGLIPRPSA
jgi:arylformamidase